MLSSQRHSLVVERRIIRGDGRQRPGDENKVVAFFSDDDGLMAEVLASGGKGMAMADGTGLTPLAEHVRPASVSDEYLEMMERRRWEAERT